MIFCSPRFNLYLAAALLGLALFAPAAPASEEKKKKIKEPATFRLHIETNPDPTDRTREVPVYRKNPVNIPIDRSPALTEMQVKSAALVDTPGGFALRVDLDRKGTWLLELVTTENRGRRMPIFCTFLLPDTKKKNAEGRWLAAPLITKTVKDGVLIFTPDATREETEYIVMGLNNAAKKYQ